MKKRGKPQLRRSKRKAGLAKIDNDVGVFAAKKISCSPECPSSKVGQILPGLG